MIRAVDARAVREKIKADENISKTEADAKLKANIIRNLERLEAAIVEAAKTKDSVVVQYAHYDDPKFKEVIDGVVHELKAHGYEIVGQEVALVLAVPYLGVTVKGPTSLELTISW